MLYVYIHYISCKLTSDNVKQFANLQSLRSTLYRTGERLDPDHCSLSNMIRHCTRSDTACYLSTKHTGNCRYLTIRQAYGAPATNDGPREMCRVGSVRVARRLYRFRSMKAEVYPTLRGISTGITCNMKTSARAVNR